MINYWWATRPKRRLYSISGRKMDEIQSVLSVTLLFIDRPEEQEYFHRKYGV